MSVIRTLAARAMLGLAMTIGTALIHPVPSLAAGVTITILESFDPDSVTVIPGTTITWVNESGNRHRVRTTSGPAEFDSGNLDPGAQFSVTLTAVGTYAYRDHRNPDDGAFRAEIIVAESASAASPTTPGAATTPAPPAATGDVGMAGKAFRPSRITIAPGGSVTWRNDDDRDHTVTATNDAFDSGTLAPGTTYKRTFPNAGSFTYLCLIHPAMTGTVVVTGPGTTPPATPAPTPAPTPTPLATPPPGSIRAVDFAFQPASLTVGAGTRVTFVNAGKAPHTLTARDGSFDSGTIAAGGSWTRTFGTAGTFPFLCAIHPQMVGTVLVTDSSGIAPPAAVAVEPQAPVPDASDGLPDGQASPTEQVTATAQAVGGVGGAGNTGGSATISVPASFTGPVEYLGVALAFLLSGVGLILFMRTIAGAVRQPDPE